MMLDAKGNEIGMANVYFKLPFVEGIVPIKFHPYTSRVLNRLITVECESKESMQAFRMLEQQLVTIFRGAGIKCHEDNKTVFECDVHGVRIFYGFYDWRFAIGLSYEDENERY